MVSMVRDDTFRPTLRQRQLAPVTLVHRSRLLPRNRNWISQCPGSPAGKWRSEDIEDPRHVVISDSVLSQLAHHRGQLTVYLRLNGALVPAIYGPSAGEQV
jgi:DinB family